MTERILSAAQRAVSILIKQGKTVASAESCTGGLLSAALTAIPGASAVIGLGVCSYSIEIKNKILGVSMETLSEFGAVSRETAAEMAECVRRLADADIAVSVTGSAGPEPAEGKAPGTVYIGISDSSETKVEKLELDAPGREIVRETAVYEALKMIISRCEAIL